MSSRPADTQREGQPVTEARSLPYVPTPLVGERARGGGSRRNVAERLAVSAWQVPGRTPLTVMQETLVLRAPLYWCQELGSSQSGHPREVQPAPCCTPKSTLRCADYEAPGTCPCVAVCGMSGTLWVEWPNWLRSASLLSPGGHRPRPRGIAVRNLRKPVSLSVQEINNYGGDPLKHLILSKTKKAKPMWPENVCCVLTKAKPVPLRWP